MSDTPEPRTEQSASGARLRHGVRILLLDDDARTLLFRSDDDERRPFWYPPGGGSEPGETAEETARRELREETGLTDVALVEFGRRRAIASWGGTMYDFRERWFLCCVPAFEISTLGFTAAEMVSIIGHRWWTLDELRVTADRLVPANLAALVLRLTVDGLPAELIELAE